MSARLLVNALRNPNALELVDWTALVSTARSEQLAGSLAARLAGHPLPPAARRLLDNAAHDAAHERTQALWEAEMCRRALEPLNVPVVLLKGTAFHAADLDAAAGRSVGDLDILVPRADIGRVEQALVAAGWEPMKEAGGYDDLYYRQWMHELPPLVHRDRNRMIDVHHTILPLTARPQPDAAALLANAIPLGNGLRVLAPADMVAHAAAHLLADGDLAGGLRNLWDIDRLLRQFTREHKGFWGELAARSELHGLRTAVARALRLTHRLYGTPVAPMLAGAPRPSDRWFVRRLLARDSWGRATRPATQLGFYVRSHWLRMPPMMLARHLWTKASR